jgi:hypothetical protein
LRKARALGLAFIVFEGCILQRRGLPVGQGRIECFA